VVNVEFHIPKSRKEVFVSKTVTILGLLAFALIFIFSANLYGEEHPEKPFPTIQVTGVGSVKGEPDAASFRIGVTTSASSARRSQKENTDEMNKVIGQLKKSGIDKKDIKTTRYNINPEYEYKNRVRTFKGYKTVHVLSVTLHKIEKLGEILDAVVSAGSNDVSGIRFFIEEPAGLENQARAQAVLKAREKAKVLAEAAGVKVGKLISIQETLDRRGPIVPMAMAAGDAQSGVTQIEKGEMEIIARVHMRYAIEE
jgi:uncharacterized protein YggE